jgi:fucose permease
VEGVGEALAGDDRRALASGAAAALTARSMERSMQETPLSPIAAERAEGTNHAPSTAELRAARIACGTIFFVNGACFASWVVRIPAVQRRFALDAGTLGLVLLALAGGGLLATPAAAALVARWGARAMTRAAALIFSVLVAPPGLASSVTMLTLALVALGAANGTLNVAMNAQAAEIERRYGRPIMSSFHALFSLGGLVGAAVGGVVAERGVGPAAHLAGAALVAVVVTFVAGLRLLPSRANVGANIRFTRPTRALLVLGVVIVCCAFSEGAMDDWSTIFLRDVAGARPGAAAAGFAAFSLTMAAGRFAGDWTVARLGVRRQLCAGGLTAAAGVVLAVAVATPWAGIVGFGLVGVGLSTLYPIVVSAAGRMPGADSGTAIAAVTGMGGLGFLAGPPLIGLLADQVTIRIAILMVPLAGVVVAVVGRRVREPEAHGHGG